MYGSLSLETYKSVSSDLRFTPLVELVLVRILIVFKKNFNLVVHLRTDIIAKATG
jgi:hypothetical protein